MAEEYDVVYLSPHLDDAVLSCGGQIYQHVRDGHSVLVVTVMAGDPPEQDLSDYARSLHTRWELPPDTTSARRAEDRTACRILGADALHWDVPDCIYRTDPQGDLPFYVSDPDIFGAVHPADMALVDVVAQWMVDLPACQTLIVPLGVGNHVDHQLVRLAAEQVTGHMVDYYYEDFPYAQQAAAVERIVGQQREAWEKRVVSLDEEAIVAKVEAIAAYESQLSTFFADRVDLAFQVRDFLSKNGGEGLWRRAPMPSR